ncbi:C39 family peptidase [Planococcus lenghuensis]|uniref:Peptidase C39-like domain-containing protein n=1 Tax=Planococcus lenghuensis TaxID=2213202 RepID=A0A1Q2L3L9_9BACL|nr:C39 family peptidase [Planococcus lenghuensis]AQQ55016.1 hypothetical protein B0X71_05900 [Planococcus lenghuensis]
METLIPFRGQSQYDAAIHPRLQGSACGPVTVAVILQHHEKNQIVVDDFYKQIGGTRIGLFTWRMIRRLRRSLGSRYHIAKAVSLEDVKQELLAGRPVAMKFDKHFSFRWFQKPAYRYHWVPLVGFHDEEDDVTLFFHDNGGRGRESRLRKTSWKRNRDVLSFVKIVPVDSLS